MCLTVAQAESASDACYGHLQANPAIELIASLDLAFTANNTVHIYTSLLESSTCSSGELKNYYFCYRPYCSPTYSGSINSPVFYILLLLDTSEGYTVVHVHEEREEDGLCNDEMFMIGPSPSCCCKHVFFEASNPIMVNSSYALAFVMPEDTSGEYLYSLPTTRSMGFITTLLSLPRSVPREGDTLEPTGIPAPITSHLFRATIEPPEVGEQTSV